VRISQEPPSPADSLVFAARAGIHRLAVPTPFLVGRVNCYLIDDDPLTLIDTGPNSGTSLDELQLALAEHGHTVEDIELIVLTHQHMDHLGLLEILTRRSGAEVAAFHSLKPYLADFAASAVADDAFSAALMRRHGIPDDVVTALGSVGAAYRAFGSSGVVTRQLHDGDLLELRDRSFRVLHRPGHSPSDIILFDERRRIMIAGDHLLLHVSSNPLISRPLADGSGSDPQERPRALLDYLGSMNATQELPAELVLTGHGDPVTDHGALIDERQRMHKRRARKIHRMLFKGPLAAYEIALGMWGNVAVTQAYLALSEVLGHLDLLALEGRVTEVEHDGIVRFEARDIP
jgi:glyoxylase-like metal-dependent hydrolase (beta-lactamase superfamily II)